MKPSSATRSGKANGYVLIALAVVVVGLGIWWLSRPTAKAPDKMVVDKKVETTKPMAQIPSVAAMPQPEVARVATATSTAVANNETAPETNADPQADLKTAMPDIARLYRLGDTPSLFEAYTRPDKLNPADIQTMRDASARIAQNPEMQAYFQKTVDKEAQAYDTLADETPTFNEAGDEATYPWTQLMGTGNIDHLTFVKIDGKWYFKDGPGY